MIRTFLLAAFALTLGTLVGLGLLNLTNGGIPPQGLLTSGEASPQRRPSVIGFLPYFLLDRADKDYSPFITTLTYYGLTVEPDGTIRKFSQPGEAEPGWHALSSGKVDPFLTRAKADQKTLSLLIFSASTADISSLIADPKPHATTLINEVAPLMETYGFTDLNLDLESFSEASVSAQENFTSFVVAVRQAMQERQLGTLSLEASPSDLILPRLINLEAVAPHVDQIILMTYDYHYSGSSVTGAVAPIGGAGITAEFDIETAVMKARAVIPAHKLMLGVPLYGYEWEAVSPNRNAPVLPSSGQTASNRRIEELLANCASCSAQWDEEARENYVVYKNEETSLYHHSAFPTKAAMEAKVSLADANKLGGIALWALGYEGSTILDPLRPYLLSK